MSDMSAFPVGISHKARDNFGSPSPNPFGDHDYYASSDDDDGARVVKREPWSPSMSPEQNSYMDDDVSTMGLGMFTNISHHCMCVYSPLSIYTYQLFSITGDQNVLMEEVKQKLDTIDINSIAQTNMSLENPQLLVEEEIVVTSSKDEIILNSIDEYIIKNRRDDMENVHSANSRLGEGERRLNVSVSVGGGIGKAGGMRTVVLHVPKDIQ